MKITGWWAIISSAPISAASSATSFVISSVTSTLLTFLFILPVRSPELSHFSCAENGAKESMYVYISETKFILPSIIMVRRSAILWYSWLSSVFPAFDNPIAILFILDNWFWQYFIPASVSIFILPVISVTFPILNLYPE